MMSLRILLLQLLLLVSPASASHFYGGTSTFTYKGKNPNGSLTVVFRRRVTFDGCLYRPWGCRSGNCGIVTGTDQGTIDIGTSAPVFNRQWCETETVEKRVISSDKPFELSMRSCCWIPKRLGSLSWVFLAHVDLGRRSDTGIPNRSPDVAILPFLRVPQNCPRTYKLMSFDPDGDQVKCRYGISGQSECVGCVRPPGFILDEASCTLKYQHAAAKPQVFGFELVVEDFPRKHITLSYTDGSSVHRSPLVHRRKRQAPLTTPYYTSTTTPYYTSPTRPYYTSTTRPYYTSTTRPYYTSTTRPYYTSTTRPYYTSTTRPYYTATTTPYYTSTTTPYYTSTTRPYYTSTTRPYYTSTTRPYYTSTTRPYYTSTTTPYYTSTTTPYYTSTTTPYYTSTTRPYYTSTTRPYYTSTTTPYYTSTTTPYYTSTTRPYYTTTTTPYYTSTTRPYYTTTTTPYYTTTPFSKGYKPPLSKLPLLFSLLVDPPVPTCEEGVYIPKLVYPSPQDGARIQAEVDKVVEIRVKGEVEYGKIHGVIISGPLNITKRRTTHDEFVISWKPTEHNLWNHYPICFAVESVTESYTTTTSPTTTYHHVHNHHQHQQNKFISHSGIYHSEMRCIIVDVREGTIKTNVICTEETMTVEVAKQSFAGFHGDNLHLNDPSDIQCSLQTYSNRTHFIGIIPLNSCGTQIEEDDDNLIFRNSITAFDDYSNTITRKHLLDVQFYCQYPKRGNVTLNFVAHRKKLTVWDRGMGTFTYQFEFYPDDTYGTMINPNTYPLVYKVGTRIYMQIEATTSVSNTELFVETCRASPYDTPDYTPTYSIIENGCNVDKTVENHPSTHQRMFRFSMEAFKFIGMYPQVYISCSVLMCEAGNPNTRCAKGCLPGAWPNGHSGHATRRRREAAIQSQSHFVSQGPLRLTRAAEESGGSVTLNLNLVFIAGCLLAAVAMISALVLYRTRRGRAGYHPLQLTDTEEF